MKISSLIVIVALSVVAWMPSASAQDPNAPPGEAQSMQQPVDQTQLAEEEQGRPWVETGPDGQPIQPESGSETAAPEEATPALTTPLRKGLSIQGSLGLSDCLGEFCGDQPPGDVYEGASLGIGGELSGWFRPIEYVSLGLTLHYNLIAVDDQPLYDNSWNYFVVDIGARLHPLAQGPIDIFIGPTFGYAWFNTSYESDALFEEGDLSLDGWTLGGEIGGEYFITPQMSAGLLFRYLYPFWSQACSGDNCLDVDDIPGFPDFEDDIPTMFYIGATFTYHIQFGT